MTFECASPLLGVGHRSPNDQAVNIALLDVDNVNRAVLRSLPGARLGGRGLEVRIAWPLATRNIPSQVGGEQRRLERAAAKQGR